MSLPGLIRFTVGRLVRGGRDVPQPEPRPSPSSSELAASVDALALALALQAVNPPPAEPFAWDREFMRRHPWKTSGVAAFLVGRYLFGAFFVYGCYHKTVRQWLWSDVMQQHFRTRLAQINPASFQATYLRQFAIPWHRPIAWVLVLGQLSVSLSMLLGVAVRPNALLALFLLLNISAGSFFNPSMPPFIIYSLLLMILPSGHWLGLDKWLHTKYPDAIWFQ